MLKWKPWQFVFLAYLLVLNLTVCSALAFFILSNNFRRPPQATSVTSGPTSPNLVAYSTSTLLESNDQASQAQESLGDGLGGGGFTGFSNSIPSLDIPPVPVPTKAEVSTSEFESQLAAEQPASVAQLEPSVTNAVTPTPTETRPPRPTATPTKTPTRTPHPSATPTASATSIPTFTATATRTPTHTPRPTITSTRQPAASILPTATLTSSSLTPSATGIALAGLSADSSADTFEHDLLAQTSRSDWDAGDITAFIDGVALTNGSVALSWDPAKKAYPYRIYGDMGTGYGVYIYKTHTTQPAFVDEVLRPGVTYHYRITQLKAENEIFLAQARATTLAERGAPGEGVTSPTQILTSVAPIPTALPQDTVVLGLVSDNNFTDDFNTLTIVGEVRNDATLYVGRTRITVTFYDVSNAVIDTADGETMLDVIPPGESSPFLIRLTRPTGLASYSLRALARPVITPASDVQLAVVEVKRYEDDAGFFHITGTIDNVGWVVAERTKVAAIIYGRNGDVINAGFTYVTPPALAPGEQASYDVIFTNYSGYLTQTVLPFQD